jgi:hypothetical protein
VTARQTSRSSSTTETTSTVPALDMRRGHRSQPLSAGFGARRHSRRTPTASHARFRFRLLALVPHSRSEAAYATSARSLALRGNWNVSFTRNAWVVLSTRRGAWSPRMPRQDLHQVGCWDGGSVPAALAPAPNRRQDRNAETVRKSRKQPTCYRRQGNARNLPAHSHRLASQGCPTRNVAKCESERHLRSPVPAK